MGELCNNNGRLICFNERVLRYYIGAVVHVRTEIGFWGNTVRRVLGSWGNHDAEVVLDDGVVKIGSSEPPCSRLYTLSEYADKLYSVGADVKVFVPDHYYLNDGLVAGAWWVNHVNNRFYDFMAYPRLFIKALTKDIFVRKFKWEWAKQPAGWEWANWCTEGWADSWKKSSVHRDVLGNDNPTPLTVEKRAAEGRLKEITGECITYKNVPIGDTAL